MNIFIRLLSSVLPNIESQSERDEAYLAESVDLYDLERRMVEIDRRSRDVSPGLVFAQGLR